MIFDTDLFIWVQRGNKKAAHLMDGERQRYLSVCTYMELLQGAQDKKQQHFTTGFLNQYGFEVLPLTENIGHRAAVYVEEYSLSTGLRAVDALIAATAVEKGLLLCTGNRKHFRMIKDLQLKVFEV